MKKQLFFLFGLLMISTFINAQIIISQWTFPVGDTTSNVPDSCITPNVGYSIYAQDTAKWSNTVVREHFFTSGASTSAAGVCGWNNGANKKVWSVKFKTNNATNLAVSSKQSSGFTYPGPKYWKIQAQISGQPWVDITGGNITVNSNWTTGTVTNLPLGSAFDNKTSSLYIRWVMVSDSSTAGTLVDSTGVSKIDDIIIKGNTSTFGVEEVLFDSRFNVYPNPLNSEILNIESTKGIINLNVYNIEGKLVESYKNIGYSNKVNFSNLKKGVYFLKPEYFDKSFGNIEKLIIE
jgi:hypothetical protein